MSDTVRIVRLDSTAAFYEIMQTETNEMLNTLSCTLSHFSGYGTDDPDYMRLQIMIASATD
jgi:hypothetical protein